jgi:hypothetical protein
MTVLISPPAWSAGKTKDHDPSALTGPYFGDLPEGLPEANEGALEGGQTGTLIAASAENVLQSEDQRDDGRFNILPMDHPAVFLVHNLLHSKCSASINTNASDPRAGSPDGNGGMHLMMRVPGQNFTAGQSVEMTLNFKSGRQQVLWAVVENR